MVAMDHFTMNMTIDPNGMSTSVTVTFVDCCSAMMPSLSVSRHAASGTDHLTIAARPYCATRAMPRVPQMLLGGACEGRGLTLQAGAIH